MSFTTPKTFVFIDASVWIAASGSSTGGSSLVLDICRGQHFAALCSERVLLEAQTNIRNKLPIEALVRFYQVLAATAPEIVQPAAPPEETAYEALAGSKDAHVIASAVRGQASYLVTLDRKHLANEAVRRAGLPFQVLLPGEFIQEMLSTV
jgi:putative PIN family toxin of toxin-antitoxin system